MIVFYIRNKNIFLHYLPYLFRWIQWRRYVQFRLVVRFDHIMQSQNGKNLIYVNYWVAAFQNVPDRCPNWLFSMCNKHHQNRNPFSGTRKQKVFKNTIKNKTTRKMINFLVILRLKMKIQLKSIKEWN